MYRALGVMVLAAGLPFGTFAQATHPAGSSCENLAGLALAQAKVTSAQAVAAGAFVPPATGAPLRASEAAFYKSLPSFCRVTVESTPSADSDIKIEVWMPVSGWNGRLQGLGNGGFAGQLDYHSLGETIADGYAAVNTDTGHSGSPIDSAWALGHPEKVTDFGYRAIHEMTLVAKASVMAFYGANPQRSYFAGCSNGGRQALMEAQRYPEDYDGIIAGAPANNWTHLLTSAIWNAQALTFEPASYIPTSKIAALSHAVNDACDSLDGVKDGILNDPRQCHFDPAVLLCKSGDADSCLTAPQVTTLKKLYEGAHDSHGARIFPGFVPGAEAGGGGWGLWITGPAPRNSLLFAFGNGFFSNMVYQKADWDYATPKLDDVVKAADETSRTFNATDANLAPFKSRGGKLIVIHGWNDPAISALNTLDYYQSVESTMGRANADLFMRVYMVPGTQHCSGGPGPSLFATAGAAGEKDPQHNLQLALEQWVEKGAAPSTII
ncbi:MAG: tannase/feruloyl esterase family alpha/beta hydrolase, partial [Bryobacteraceae bacterium]